MSSPKYIQIYNELREQIQNGTYPSDSYLPSENELMSLYGASRDTIRKSLNQLAANGYIQKEKGKGSLVLANDAISFPVSGLTSFKELQNSSMHSSVVTHLISFEEKKPDARMQEKLNMQDGEIFEVRRVREIDGEKIIYDHDFLNASLIPGLKPEHAADSIYEYIEKNLGKKVSFARKEITVVPATREDRELLDLNGYDLLVSIKSYNFLEDASLFCYTESRHRPDKFRFIDFSRREHQ